MTLSFATAGLILLTLAQWSTRDWYCDAESERDKHRRRSDALLIAAIIAGVCAVVSLVASVL